MYQKRIQARDRFLKDRQVSPNVSEEVIESWQRSLSYQIDPTLCIAPKALPKEKLLHAQKTKEINTAFQSILPKIESLFDEKYAIVLADEHGRILNIRAKGPLCDGLESVNFIPGGNWNETAAGTNGIGTCIVTNKPIVIHNTDHFCESWQLFSCSGAPIFHPFSGNVVGVLDLTCFTEDFPENGVILTSSLAKGIEIELQHLYQIFHLFLENEYLKQEIYCRHDILLAVDRDGMILQKNNRPILHDVVKDFDWDGYFYALSTLPFAEEDSKRDVFLEQPVPFLKGHPTGKIRLIHYQKQIIGIILQIPTSFLQKRRSSLTNSMAKSGKKESRSDAHPAHLKPEHLEKEGLVGQSAAWLSLIDNVQKVLDKEVTIFITGESGTGKEVLAQYIYRHSNRKEKPFLPFNCAGLAHDLAASEIFGYAPGTFTGGLKEGKPGLFESAEGGILFLDEIAELPPQVQAMLLRVLQEKQVSRIGERHLRQVDVRLIAATNQDLRKAANEGNFRWDLYHRLNVVSFHIPPLRTRREDILPLAQYFLRQAEPAEWKFSLAPQTEKLLLQYDWPGNVRELKSVIERAKIFAEEDTITLQDLPEFIFYPNLLQDGGRNQTKEGQRNLESSIPYSSTLETSTPESTMPESPFQESTIQESFLDKREKDERELLLQLLQSTHYNITKTAKLLGISRGTLYTRLKKYNIQL